MIQIPNDIEKLIWSFRETNEQAIRRKFTRVVEAVQIFGMSYIKPWGARVINFHSCLDFAHGGCTFEGRVVYGRECILNSFYILKYFNEIISSGELNFETGLNRLLTHWQFNFANLDDFVELSH